MQKVSSHDMQGEWVYSPGWEKQLHVPSRVSQGVLSSSRLLKKQALSANTILYILEVTHEKTALKSSTGPSPSKVL